MFDYIIVGNGILALSTAFRLSTGSPESKICIIGRTDREGCATAAAGAMLSSFGELTHDSTSSKEGMLHFDISYKAMKLWPDFINQLNSFLNPNEQLHISENGTYMVINAKGTMEGDDLNYKTILQMLKTYNEPHSEVDGGDIPGLFPDISARPFKGLYMPNERYINPNLVLLSLEKILHLNSKISFLNDSVQTVLINNDSQVMGVIVESGEKYYANQVIISAGVGTQKIINSIPSIKNRIPRILSGNGTAFLIDQKRLSEPKIRSVIRTPNRAGACGLHCVPRDNDLDKIYVGAGNVPEWDYEPSGSFYSARWILNGVVSQFNQNLARTKITHIISGARPFSIDEFPILGQSSSIRGLWFLSGTSRDGFHCSPLISLYAANQILAPKYMIELNQEASHVFNVYAPERPLIQNRSQEQTIHEAQVLFYCLFHESGSSTQLKFPLTDWVEKDVRNIYDQLETNYTLSPMILLPLITRLLSIDTVKSYLADTHKAWELK